ncbi:MAG: hypothetical protein GEU88_02350 [Solirubrobacterales bacterium]|nr:hypothetical protein [Solirubrobacterales bacterium]
MDRDRKPEYIECLEAADLGELRYLSRFFGLLERDDLVRALGIGDQAVRELEGLEQVIRSARDELMRPMAVEPEELKRVRATADSLLEIGRHEMEAVKVMLDREISDYRPEFSARVECVPPSDDRAHWYFAEIVEIAQREFHYFANPRTYAAWARLRIADRDASTWDDLIVSFHGVGREFRGLIAVTAFYNRYQLGSERGKKDRRRTHSKRISDELFQINYLEDPEQAADRFREWLRGVLTIGLGQWRRGLPAARGT